ncbi:unnamed protein product [Mycena citricolor]|uniref:ATP-dependent DNA helicase PIF1 n=1 Tax=Mycena citricolor TaxID=2018698 RepID=A0AAD2HTN7_9AGAR|nr:unnamed protein product [Mycena citricolor]
MRRALKALPQRNSMAKFYAVARGREGPKIYSSWDDAKDNVTRFPGAKHASFKTQAQAEMWLATTLSLLDSHTNSSFGPQRSANTRPSAAIAKPYTRPPVLQGAPSTSSYPDSVSSSHAPFIDPELEPAPIALSSEQNAVLQRILSGTNTFFSGSAGTGKSVLLREIIRRLRWKGSESVGVTASTGIAAINIGGSTINSWAGIGLGKLPVEKLIGPLMWQPKYAQAKTRWLNAETLIIDEVSMIDGTLLDKLEAIARAIKQNDKPFGGIQVVLCGDFFQLPPVPDTVDGKPILPTFAFDSAAWSKCIDKPVILTQVFRQKNQEFVDILNAMRFGKVHDSEAVRALARDVQYTDGIMPTELRVLARRDEVDRVNRRRLDTLTGECQTYESMDVAGVDSNGNRLNDSDKFRILSRLVVPQRVSLKVGAQVMLVKNLVQGRLVNGSIGRVVRFATAAEAALERMETSTPDGPGAARTDRQPERRWPVVKFIDGSEVFMTPLEFTIHNAEGGMEARRDQIPLILSWAISIHKSQGQTIERVRIDMRNIFEKGQAYVAMSRAVSLDGLQVVNFSSSKVMAHPRVLEWHEALGIKQTASSPERRRMAPRNRETLEIWSEDEDGWDIGRDNYYR